MLGVIIFKSCSNRKGVVKDVRLIRIILVFMLLIVTTIEEWSILDSQIVISSSSYKNI
jgi:hypothetical protein